MKPKVFISYSWTSPGHQMLVKSWADRLMADGVDVVIDIYDLREGQDKFAFMERMVTDPTVLHVLMICDKSYAEKADARRAGVGTESQILSKEVYEKVNQSKFIPIVCEFDDQHQPQLPTFLKSRIWIDFSNPEATNQNWEQLIRVLFGRPLHVKPNLGNPPAYVRDDSPTPVNAVDSKYRALEQALIQGKSRLDTYRSDFLSASFDFANELRVRQEPQVQDRGEKVLTGCKALKPLRDRIVEWVMLEASLVITDGFGNALHGWLEQMLELKSRPEGMNVWNETWFDAHSFFVYESFLYIIAALLKRRAFPLLHEVFASHYLLPLSERRENDAFESFDKFNGKADSLQAVLAPPGRTLHSPAAALIKQHSDRSDLPFGALLEADLLALMMAFLTPGTRWWPQTLYYSSESRSFGFFLRSTRNKDFKNLATITGIEKAEDLRIKVKAGQERLGVERWHKYHVYDGFWSAMNMDKLDTLK